MRLPKMRAMPGRARQQIIEFRGINYGEDTAPGELAESENLRSDLYPCLSPSRKKGSGGFAYSDEYPRGITSAGGDLFRACGSKIYRNATELATVSDGTEPVKLVKINTKLVVFPDKVYYNLKDEDNYELLSGEPADWESGYASYFAKDGEAFRAVTKEEAAAGWNANMYYRYTKVHPLEASVRFPEGALSFSGGVISNIMVSTSAEEATKYYALKKTSKVISHDELYQYKRVKTIEIDYDNGGMTLTSSTVSSFDYKAEEVFQYIGDVMILTQGQTGEDSGSSKQSKTAVGVIEYYSGIAARGIVTSPTTCLRDVKVRMYRLEEVTDEIETDLQRIFKKGDAVKISGCISNRENDKELVIRDITPTSIVFDDGVFEENEWGFEFGSVTIERRVPDMEIVFEHNNRLWGAGENKIYASALGDPTNFNVFEGLASDAYAVAVGSDGEFTGGCGYGGAVILFKEHLMYKIIGDYPANFVMSEYNVPGVKARSSESVVNINERLYYHSEDGIYAYTGSVPVCISRRAFGEQKYERASAGAHGSCLYVSMRTRHSSHWQLFKYDTERDIWLRESDSYKIWYFTSFNGMLYGLEALGYAPVKGYNTVIFGAYEEAETKWSAELAEITEYINERKCYSKLLLRLDMEEGSRAKVEISCDRGEWKTVWERSAESYTEGEHRSAYTATVPIRPTRCDRFKIRISGTGEVVIRSLIREYEQGSEV
ncbi:MAG: hypothetical protein IJN09_06600 [Oscillospiraceae bacterium]|nr:hypothetical protein [Oscillospiraceae bacterium]